MCGRLVTVLPLLILIFGQFVASGHAAAITGRDFSIGLGFTEEESIHLNGPVTWNDRETYDSNAYNELSSFSFTPTVTGALFSGRGPGFRGRTLTDGTLELGNTDNKVGFLGGGFEVAIEASFDRSAPGNADRDDPNYRLEVEITNISIYAGAFEGDIAPAWNATPTLQWTETTSGYERISGAPTELNLIRDVTTDYQTAANYTRVEADPVDFIVPIDTPNETVTRTFSLSSNEMLMGQGGMGPENWTIGDGFEVTGRVRLYYNARGELPPEYSCDFSDDGLCTTADIDSLVEVVIADTHTKGFDVTGEGLVTVDDLAQWRAIAAEENGFSEPYLEGDANLDGVVDAADLNRLALNWNESPNTWSGGDFLAAGTVNASSLNLLGVNWGRSIPLAAQAVPEPSCGGCAVLAGLVLLFFRRRR